MNNKPELYSDGHHSIYFGDVMDSLALLRDNSADLIFADPPYNIGKIFGRSVDKWPSDAEYAEWCYQWLALCVKKLSDSGSLYVMSSTQCMPYLDIFLRTKLEILSRIVWHYDSSGVQAKNYYGSQYEPMLFCVKNKNRYLFNSDSILVDAKTGAERKLIDYRKSAPAVYNSKKVPGNAWYMPRVRYKMKEYEHHPSQKPEALLERIILASSNRGDTVLDPFSGSFTTSAVAKRLGRKSIGIEREEEYIQIGLRRVLGFEELNGKELKPVLKNHAARADANQLALLESC